MAGKRAGCIKETLSFGFRVAHVALKQLGSGDACSHHA